MLHILKIIFACQEGQVTKLNSFAYIVGIWDVCMYTCTTTSMCSIKHT